MTDKHSQHTVTFNTEGDRAILHIECRLGTMPVLLQSLIENTILPLAETVDPETLKIARLVDDVAKDLKP